MFPAVVGLVQVCLGVLADEMGDVFPCLLGGGDGLPCLLGGGDDVDVELEPGRLSGCVVTMLDGLALVPRF